MERFSDKIILISGGARGQGAVEAEMLIAEGAQVVIGDIRDDDGRALIERLGPKAHYLHLDVTKAADWDAAVAYSVSLGGLHGLINNAGIFQPATLTDTDEELWNRHVAINQTGCYLGMRAVVSAMEASGGGAIVNISSNAGLQGTPGAFAYGATKWALRGMTKSAALDFVNRKIRVNSIHPGPIDTEMLHARNPEDHAKFMERVPMKRMGSVQEIAKLVLFALSDDCGFMTGAELTADGGLSV